MISWWRHLPTGNYFGVLANANGDILPGHEVQNSMPRTEDQLRRQFPQNWITTKVEQINRLQFDIERPTESWVDGNVYAILLADANQQMRRDQLLDREGLMNIPGEDEDEKPKSTKWVELETTSIPPREQPRFWIPYQTGEEICMRLLNSIICVHSKPFQVHRVEARANNRDWLMYLLDGDGGRFTLPYSSPAVDLRSPDPGYGVNREGLVSYLVRRPERVQRQGMCTENTLRKNVGKKAWTGLGSQQEILHYLTGRKTRPVTEAILATMQNGLLNNVLLSPKVALVNKVPGIVAEYKGRILGRVYTHDKHVSLSDEDKNMSHINRDLQAVHLEV